MSRQRRHRTHRAAVPDDSIIASACSWDSLPSYIRHHCDSAHLLYGARHGVWLLTLTRWRSRSCSAFERGALVESADLRLRAACGLPCSEWSSDLDARYATNRRAGRTDSTDLGRGTGVVVRVWCAASGLDIADILALVRGLGRVRRV